ncbi:MAG TPA: FAD-binding protein [Symbiobacteriaceae bacterium]|jgi:3-oxosteroid 1-dehydrogenase
MGKRPQRWDLEVDLVAVGSGIGGLSAAIAGHDAGLKTVVLEKSGKLGGVTAYSFGEVWVGENYLETAAGIADSQAEAATYIRWLSAGHNEDDLTRCYVENSPVAARYFAEKAGIRFKIIKDFADYYYPEGPGAKPQGRFLEVEPFPGKELGDWAPRTRLSPYVPSGITHDEMFAWGGAASMSTWDFGAWGARLQEDIRTLGPGLAAAFVKPVLDRQIPIYTETPATELIIEDGRVIGVKAEKQGEAFFIQARGGVVLATGGYDWHREMAHYYEHFPEWNTGSPPSVTGDNLILAGEAGAIVASVPTVAMPTMLGIHIPGEEQEGQPLYRFTLSEPGLPHAILVNREGKRFADESFYRAFITAVRTFDGATQTYPNWPCYLILDQNHRDKYPLGSIPPGAAVPAELAVQGNTLGELAEKLGIAPAGLEETVRTYNQYCETGDDPEFRRGQYPWSRFMVGDLNVKPNPTMGPLLKPPFYGIRPTIVNAGINAAGLKINTNAQVLSLRGQAIPGLYAAGNAVAYLDMGSGYQSGFANGRGMTYGYLAALHAAGRR